MSFFDLSLEELQVYKPARTEPEDFEAFWQETLAEARQFPLDARFEQVDYPLTTLECYDVTFNGYGGQPIKGWFLLPPGRTKPLPCIVEYVHYGGGRGFPLQWLTWASVGFANLVMDTRGQGSSSINGDTPDPEPLGTNPQFPGFMTRGVLDPRTYYYRRLYTDAVRAIEAARVNPAVDPARIGVTGMSQGGGLSIAAAALVPDVAACMPDVPYLCAMRRATQITDTNPYQELVRFCKIHRDKVDTVFHTLSYFDGVNLATRARAPALFSAGLMDDICPPSTVYAAYNYYGGPKEMFAYEYNQHDGGGLHHIMKKIGFARRVLL